MTAHLLPNEENIKRGEDDKFSLVNCSLLVNSYLISRNLLNWQSCVLETLASCVCMYALFSLRLRTAMEVFCFRRAPAFLPAVNLPRPFSEVFLFSSCFHVFHLRT